MKFRFETASRRVCIGAGVIFLCGSAGAAAQPEAGAGLPGSRIRAAQDWEVLTASIDNLSEAATAAYAAFSEHSAAFSVVVAVALLLGALIGRFLSSAPAEATPPAARADAPQGRPRRRSADAAAPGMIFRPEDRARRPSSTASREAVEARRLFDYFEERFLLEERSAGAAIDYLERISQAVERVRSRAKSAETALERALDQKLAPSGGAPGAGASGPLAGAIGAVRTARMAIQTLRSRSDPALLALLAETDLEDALRRVAGLNAAQAQGEPLDPFLIEERWPHQLFRTASLLGAYFPADGLWGELRDGCGGAAAALRGALRDVQIIVGHVRLLSPYKPSDGEIWSDDLGALGEVEGMRAALSRIGGRGDLVVDCETFGYVDRARGVSAQARLIVERRSP